MTKKVICITGCSSGFGLALTNVLAQNHIVYATARSPETASALQALRTCYPDTLFIRSLDVTQPETITPVFDEIKVQHRRLDVLINNAGYALGGFFEDLTEEEIKAQFETNFFGVQNVTRAALPLIRNTPASKIIMLSSIAGLVSTPSISAYNASKWALEGFSESLYFELKPFDTHVILIEPGVFQTNILTQNKTLAKNILHPNSPYLAYSKAILARFDAMLKKPMDNPVDAAHFINKLITKKHPKLRYILGKQARLRWLLKRLLPFKLYSRIILKYITSKIH